MQKIKTHILKIEKFNQILKQIEQETQNLVIEIETINESENKNQIQSDSLKPPTLS